MRADIAPIFQAACRFAGRFAHSKIFMQKDHL